MKKISARDIAIIAELQTRQDFHAFSLGVMEAEYLQKRAACFEVSEPGREDLIRIGAIEFEHHRQQAYWFEKIVRTRMQQAAAGEAALRRAGVNPTEAEYTIAAGVIMKNLAGAWVPLEG